MTFTIIINAVLAVAVFASLIAGICAISGTPLTLGLRKMALRVSATRSRLARAEEPEKAPVGVELGL